MSAKSIIKSRKGYSVLLVVLGIIVAGIAMLPITKWYLSLHAGMEDLDTRFEMQSIVQDAWNRLLAEDYDETTERIATKGSSYTEDIGDKWTLKYTYGSEGSYESAQCNTSVTPSDDDRKCRKVTISVEPKAGSGVTAKPYSIETTRVASQGSNIKVMVA